MWTDTHAHTTRFDVWVNERVSERSTTYYWCINYRLTLYNVHTFTDAHERALTLALHSLESKNRTSAICNEIKQESVCARFPLYTSVCCRVCIKIECIRRWFCWNILGAQACCLLVYLFHALSFLRAVFLWPYSTWLERYESFPYF